MANKENVKTTTKKGSVKRNSKTTKKVVSEEKNVKSVEHDCSACKNDCPDCDTVAIKLDEFFCDIVYDDEVFYKCIVEASDEDDARYKALCRLVSDIPVLGAFVRVFPNQKSKLISFFKVTSVREKEDMLLNQLRAFRDKCLALESTGCSLDTFEELRRELCNIDCIRFGKREREYRRLRVLCENLLNFVYKLSDL